MAQTKVPAMNAYQRVWPSSPTLRQLVLVSYDVMSHSYKSSCPVSGLLIVSGEGGSPGATDRAQIDEVEEGGAYEYLGIPQLLHVDKRKAKVNDQVY